MKFSLTLGQSRPLTRAEAWGCFSANLALPGAGSLAAGRKVGYAQAALCLVGMVVSFVTAIPMIQWVLTNWSRLMDPGDSNPMEPLIQLWAHMKWPLAGLLLFIIALVWAGATGLQLVAGTPKAR